MCLAWAGSAVVRYRFGAGGNNSVVECDLAKVEVAGSNPVSRSNLRSRLPNDVSYGWQAKAKVVPPKLAQRAKGDVITSRFRPTLTSHVSAPSPSGKAEVCKTSIPGSNPGGASKIPQRFRSGLEGRPAPGALNATLSLAYAPAGSQRWAIVVATAVKAPSRSCNRYLGAWSSGKAFRSCWAVHAAVGWAVTATCTIRLDRGRARRAQRVGGT